jgi:hypothetical protein
MASRCVLGRECFWLALMLLLVATTAGAQDWSDWLGAHGNPQIRARLRDKDQNAKVHIAAVEVEVQNIWLHTMTEVSEADIPTGVLGYQLDQCPPLVSTDTRIKFEQLPAGNHSITVSLLGRDERLVAPRVKLQLTIP